MREGKILRRVELAIWMGWLAILFYIGLWVIAGTDELVREWWETTQRTHVAGDAREALSTYTWFMGWLWFGFCAWVVKKTWAKRWSEL